MPERSQLAKSTTFFIWNFRSEVIISGWFHFHLVIMTRDLLQTPNFLSPNFQKPVNSKRTLSFLGLRFCIRFSSDRYCSSLLSSFSFSYLYRLYAAPCCRISPQILKNFFATFLWPSLFPWWWWCWSRLKWWQWTRHFFGFLPHFGKKW